VSVFAAFDCTSVGIPLVTSRIFVAQALATTTDTASAVLTHKTLATLFHLAVIDLHSPVYKLASNVLTWGSLLLANISCNAHATGMPEWFAFGALAHSIRSVSEHWIRVFTGTIRRVACLYPFFASCTVHCADNVSIARVVFFQKRGAGSGTMGSMR
jgi:hypothetical protein